MLEIYSLFKAIEAVAVSLVIAFVLYVAQLVLCVAIVVVFEASVDLIIAVLNSFWICFGLFYVFAQVRLVSNKEFFDDL